jgi:hypothetical protein
LGSLEGKVVNLESETHFDVKPLTVLLVEMNIDFHLKLQAMLRISRRLKQPV